MNLGNSQENCDKIWTAASPGNAKPIPADSNWLKVELGYTRAKFEKFPLSVQQASTALVRSTDMPRLTFLFTRLIMLVLPCMGWQLALQAADEQPPLNEVRIAAVQYEIQGNQTAEQLLAKLEAAVVDAVAAEADCIVFPELITFDSWRVDDIESHSVPTPQEIGETRRIATEVTPVFLRGMAALAESYQVDILAGSTPLIDGSSIFNSAHLFFRDGSSFRQDKLYPTHWELKAGISPGSDLATCDTRWGKIAILICYDVEFPDVSCLLVSERPEIIFAPSMTESESGLQRVRWCAQARAVEHHAFVVVAGTVGSPSESWNHFGQAAFLAPRDSRFVDNPVTSQPGRAMVLTHLFNLQTLRESRQATEFNPSADITARPESLPIRLR